MEKGQIRHFQLLFSLSPRDRCRSVRRHSASIRGKGGILTVQHTRETILRCFQEMLTEMAFDRITVSALVKRCGISSNTFYYHYEDIYDLLSTWLELQMKGYTANCSVEMDWREILKDIFGRCKDNRRLIYHLFDSLSRERLEQFVFAASENIYLWMLKGRAADRDIPEHKLRELSDFCDYALFGSFIKFLWGHMSDDVDTLVDSVSDLIEGLVEATLSQYPKKNF